MHQKGHHMDQNENTNQNENKDQNDKLVELNTAETEQVVGGTARIATVKPGLQPAGRIVLA
jgi:hypothetical protein